MFIPIIINRTVDRCTQRRKDAKSMTGFGRAEVSEGDRKATVEMKSVNHRYLELGIKGT